MNQTFMLSGMSPYWVLAAVIILCSLALIIFLAQRKTKYKAKTAALEQEINQLKQDLDKLRAWDSLIPELRKIAHLDHDINTPLCVITMSLGRTQKIAIEQNDNILQGNTRDILSAVSRIGEIMQAVRVLKTNPLISIKDKIPTADAGRE
ncbi:MAG: DUF4381 domain-containing protein [Candidatus Cloacimonetes bacterium]|jgi:C4-dicarboxylate-specific signal transduction histidine kinase|nr:DUF4381 domain-containing protein [Candidatus Cloacimonadota bacterium]MDY0172721.1 hypothetical protein [Candidatus Cloacimonadaceae bacterium]